MKHPPKTSEGALDLDDLLEHRRFLQSLVRGMIADEHGVEDILQETWLKALERPPSALHSLRAWLGRVARNATLNRLRRDRRGAERDELAARPELVQGTALDAVQKLERQQQVLGAVLRLGEPRRTTIYMRYFEDQQPNEIARVMNVTVGTVNDRLWRGRQQLRRELERVLGADSPARGLLGVYLLPLAGLSESVTTALQTQLATTATAGAAVPGTLAPLTLGGLLMGKMVLVVGTIALCAAGLWWTVGGRGLPRATVPVPTPNETAVSELHPRPLDPPGLKTSSQRSAVQQEAGHSANQGEDPSLTVRVTDDRERALPGATVWLGAALSCQELGVTDAAGVLEYRGSTDSATTLVGSCPGYVTTQVPLPCTPDAPAEVHIALEEAAKIVGVVQLEDGSAPLHEVRLAAIRVDCQPRFELYRSEEPDPRVSVATSSKDGGFELGGLERFARYSVVASGNGYIARQPPAVIEAGTDEQSVVVVHCTYGVAMSLVGGDGKSLEVGSDVEYGQGTFFLCSQSMTSIICQYIEHRLAGLSTITPSATWGNDLYLMYASPVDQESVGPVKARIDRPGYARKEFEFWVERMAETFPKRQVHLVRECGGFGTLIVALSGYEAGEEVITSEYDSPRGGDLILTDANGRRLFLHLWSVENGERRFVVPYGSYIGRFKSTMGSYSFPARNGIPITISSREARMEVDLSGLRRLVVHLVAASGLELDEQVVFRLRKIGRKGYRHLRFRSAPYILEGLLEGEYEIAAFTGTQLVSPGREPYRMNVALQDGVGSQVVTITGR